MIISENYLIIIVIINFGAGLTFGIILEKCLSNMRSKLPCEIHEKEFDCSKAHD